MVSLLSLFRPNSKRPAKLSDTRDVINKNRQINDGFRGRDSVPVRGHEDGKLKGEGVSIFGDFSEVLCSSDDGLNGRNVGGCDAVSADVIFLGDPHELAFAVSDRETKSGAGVEAAQVA